jgi:beta-phosphoglucomutase-like phosphatase (HAD superfamily)
MVTDSDTQLAPPPAEPKAPSGKWLVLLELEYGLVQGREHLFAAASGVLKEKGVSLTASDFCRTGLKCHPSHVAERLISGLKIANANAGDLNTAIVESFHKILLSSCTAPGAKAAAILAEARRMNAQVAVISSLPEEVAQELLAKINTGGIPIKLIATDEPDRVFPRVETWMRAARALNRPPAVCFAIASSQEACKSALAAGMKSVAMPDAFTSFQDFSGADTVIDSDDENPAERLRELV